MLRFHPRKVYVEKSQSNGNKKRRMRNNKNQNKAPMKPRLPQSLGGAQSQIFPIKGSLDELFIEDALFEDCSESNRKGRFISFDQVILQRTLLRETTFQSLSMRDSKLLGCDLSNAKWESSFWERVSMEDSRLTGLDLTSSCLKHTLIKDCKADFSSFRFSKCTSVHFINCGLQEADFQGADLRNCVFRGCDLSLAEFSHTKLSGADFRDSKIDGIKISPENLRGVTVDVVQASYLAGLMGLIVK